MRTREHENTTRSLPAVLPLVFFGEKASQAAGKGFLVCRWCLLGKQTKEEGVGGAGTLSLCAAFVVEPPGPMLLRGGLAVDGHVGELPQGQARDRGVREDGEVVHLHQKA